VVRAANIRDWGVNQVKFEVVHTVPDWYDGPRGGIADYDGVPHLFESEWSDRKDLDPDTFLLMPIDANTFSLVMEDWEIWRRYETALHKGEVALEHHPALPEERSRHLELEKLLESKLVVDPVRAFRRQAEFRAREDSAWGGYGWVPLEVRWIDIENAE
jgi:hypothetical protein